jgi:hypothetical protein
MQSELKSLSKIFAETLLRIPDYQRGYAWEAKQLKDFWGDIEQLPPGKSHYTGVLTLQPVPDYSHWQDDTWIIESKRYVPVYVVDGQQRLTTAVILLQCILEQAGEASLLNYTSIAEIRKKHIFESRDGGISRSYLFGYERDNPSDAFLKKYVFREPSDNHSTGEETIYTKNLASAKEFFSQKLRDLALKEVEDIYTKATQHLLFNIFYIEPELDVFVTFETMNNRGKLLSHLELLKNRLIYLSTKFDSELSEREALRRAVNESWKTVYHQLGKIQLKRYDDDLFLHTHFFCHFGATPLTYLDEDGDEQTHKWERVSSDDDFAKEYLLDQYFTAKRIDAPKTEDRLQIRQIYEYAQSIRSVAETFQRVANPTTDNCHQEERTCLTQLNRLDNKRSFLLAIVATRVVKSREARVSLLRQVERTGFLTRIRPYLFNDLNLDIAAGDLLSKRSSAEEISKRLTDFTDKLAGSSEFLDAIRNLGRNVGYYSWGAIRYFMYEYEQHLRSLSKTSRELLNWREDDNREHFDPDHRTVEHIYPQRASHEYWRERFNKYRVPERNILKNSLGNLLPVSHPKNSSLSNGSFLDKLGSPDNQVGYRYGCLSEIQVSMESEWTAASILRRGLRLLEFMEKRWSLDLGDIEKKIELLGLGFVVKNERLQPGTLSEVDLKIPVAPKP